MHVERATGNHPLGHSKPRLEGKCRERVRGRFLAPDLEQALSVLGGLWQSGHRAEALESLGDCAFRAHGCGGVPRPFPHTLTGYEKRGKNKQHSTWELRGGPFLLPLPPAPPADSLVSCTRRRAGVQGVIAGQVRKGDAGAENKLVTGIPIN